MDLLNLKKEKIDSAIITNPVNIFYLSGFRGISPTERESILLLTPKPVLIVPKLYQAEGKKLEGKDLKVIVVEERNKLYGTIAKVLDNTPGVKRKRVGFEEKNLTFSEFTRLKTKLKGVKLIPVKNLVEDLRIKKSENEINAIEKAQIISQNAFGKLLPTIKIGQTEAEIAERLAKIIKDLGGEGLAFETIVARGQNAALPHYLTGKEKIKKGEVLLFDFGAKYQNYMADLSRTIFIGKPKDNQINIYQMVKKAQSEAISKIKTNIKAKSAFEAAHSVFKKEKLDNYFLHSLGHGIGLEVHEAPHLGKKGKDVLEEGMVFSVEPGLYFPAWGGVRIEDLVTIENGKARVLGKLQEEMIVLGS